MPFRKYSRRVSLGTLAPSARYFRYTLRKNDTQSFLQSLPMTYRTSRIVVAYRLNTLGFADFLLCGVSRCKNDNQSFLLVRRLFALRSQSDLGLITSKVMEYRVTTASQKRRNSVHQTVSRVSLCKGYKKDIFAVLLTGFEPHDFGILTIFNS